MNSHILTRPLSQRTQGSNTLQGALAAMFSLLALARLAPAHEYLHVNPQQSTQEALCEMQGRFVLCVSSSRHSPQNLGISTGLQHVFGILGTTLQHILDSCCVFDFA